MLGDPSVLWLNKDPCGMSEHLYPWGKTSDLQYLCLLLMVQDPAKSNNFYSILVLRTPWYRWKNIEIQKYTCMCNRTYMIVYM